jgi:hypothetical protein
MAHTAAGTYLWKTETGTFRIAFDGRAWGVWFNDDCLGEYGELIAAFEDLTGGHTSWPIAGDPSTMGLPGVLSEWHYMPPKGRV